MSRLSFSLLVSASSVAAALALTSCEPAATVSPTVTAHEPTTTATPSTTAPKSATTPPVAITPPATQRPLDELATGALATLATLQVKGRAPKTGYSRDLFGRGWNDDVDVELGHNGCDTRNDILARDLTQTATKAGTRDCVVTAGVLHDPYTGDTIEFIRGQGTSNAVQIDHIVALSDAWQKGAQQLSSAERLNFANDPRNLQATDGPTNQAKGDSDAASWLPPNRSYRCTYVARQIEVKAAYQLWVTRAEHDTMARLLTGCGGTAATTESATTTRESATTTEPAPATQESATTTEPAPATRQGLVQPSEPVFYQNCAAARAAGAAPIYRGQPGYSSKLDRDGDGIACE